MRILKLNLLTIIALLTIGTIGPAYAKYDRHDGSQYSCNEINAERAWAKKHNAEQYKALDKEYKEYCSNQ